MEHREFENSEIKCFYREESRVEANESDNESQFKSVPKEESEKWKVEKDKYNEIIEYIREIDEILNLIKPFPREECLESRREFFVRTEFQTKIPRFELNHLENIIKLVEQLKELKEKSHESGEKTFYIKDLKKLREHKMRLKSEEVKMKTRAGIRNITALDECEICTMNRKSSSTSEKLEQEPKENWQADKRKSVCLGENRSKVSKWTKVKEAFYWEKTSVGSKTLKRENSAGEKNLSKEESLESREVFPGELGVNVFCYPPPLPLPLPPPPPPPSSPPKSVRTEDLLFVGTVQDFPSSSSSDKLDDALSYSNKKENKASDPNSPSYPFLPDGVEEIETAMRKSSYEELAQHLSKQEDRSTKLNRITWSKVKDIIQTRKDSLKKKPKKRASDECKKRRKLSTVSNVQSSDQFEELSSPEDKVKYVEIIPKVVHDSEVFPPPAEETRIKRLAPTLTVTLPSTDELRNLSLDDMEKREDTEEDKMNILSQLSCEAQYCEDKSKFEKDKLGSNQRLSRWIKVKRVFLTSTPARSPQYFPVSNPSPTSQNKLSGFFSDLESDDFSSGEWMGDKSPSLEKPKPNYSELQSTAMTTIQEDIRKNYNELQKKLSQEFDQKLKEWEVKIETPANLSTKDDLSFKVKGDDGDTISKFRRSRDSTTVPLPNLNDLSPEFKKRLNDWKKMKTSQSSSSMSSSTTKDEIQGQNIKIRLGEWQPWRNRCSGKGVAKGDQGLAEYLSTKLEEEQKGSRSTRPPSNRRKDEEGGFSGSTSRRGSSRKNSVKKLRHSRSSSGGERLVSAEENSGGFIKKSQKIKDFHWVEKELQKIEKEKLRLDQEKEKYLEREARLEKMKKTMGTSPTQEILVRTPEGFFRFKGISQKFTKKLYEWEKARNIAPEASTFALIEECAKTGVSADVDAEGTTMQRSKSTGSVPELSSNLLIQTMSHHPSSLSLNDVDDLKLEEEESVSLETKDPNEEPEAIIVDVEDFEEETAVLAESPPFQSEIPVYTDFTEEIDRKTESREKFYLSSESGVEIIKEKNANMSVEIFDGLGDTENSYREAQLRVKHNGKGELQDMKDNFLQHQEKEVILEDVGEQFQAEKGKKIFEEQLQLSKILGRGYINPKTKGIYEPNTEKANNSEVADEIDLPELLQYQKGILQWMDKKQDVRGDISPTRMEIKTEAFDRKFAQELSQVKLDPQVLKNKTLMQRVSTEESWKYTDFDFRKSNEKTNTLEEENNISQGLESKFEGEPEGVFQPGEDASKKNKSISVFVQTSRKIISPVKTSDGATPSICSYVIDDVRSDSQEVKKKNADDRISPPNKPFADTQGDSRLTGLSSACPPLQTKTDVGLNQRRDIGMPPLPNSPKVYKKLSSKETAPSIRMIIAKYNQKISEHDNAQGKKTDSGSPIWKSPVFGRRTHEKIEKFCGKKDGEVLKSASLDNMRTRMTSRLSLSPTQELELPIKGILKSSSMGVMRTSSQNQESDLDVIPVMDTLKETSSSVLRAKKIQKAKEDFLSGKLADSSDPSTFSFAIESSSRAETQVERTQQENEAERSLIKSVSTETITSESGGRDFQSDVRLLEKSSSKFDISNIKSKFRKMRMRKEKDPKLNAVATLCRQSLFIEVPKLPENSSTSKSCPSSPVMDRNKNEETNKPLKK